MKTKIESFRDVWQLPLHVDEYSNTYAWSANNVMAITFATDDDILIRAIVDRINGGDVELEGEWQRSGTTFYRDGGAVFIIRGWGHLIGGGALRLPVEKAAQIQDEFCDFILSQLKGVASHKEYIICPKCGSVQEAVVKHTLPFHTYIHTCTECGYTILESEWNEVCDDVH